MTSERPEEQQAQPEQTAPAATAPLEAIDYEALIAGGMADERRASLDEDPAEAAAEPVSDEEDEPEAEEAEADLEDDDDVEDEDEDVEPSDEPDSAPEDVAEFARMVAQNPNRLSEVPGRQRPAVIRMLVAAAYQQGVEETRQQTQPQIAYATETAQWVAKIERERQDDPDAFADWSDEHPEEAARYWSVKAGRTPEAPPVQQQVSPAQQRANKIVAQIAHNPEALARINANLTAGKYHGDEDGFDQLAMDVGAELARLQTSDSEEEERAESRRRSAVRRKRAPKPIASPPAGASTPPSSLDYRTLLGEGVEAERRAAAEGRLPVAQAS